jgi:hypothetical protein
MKMALFIAIKNKKNPLKTMIYHVFKGFFNAKLPKN